MLVNGERVVALQKLTRHARKAVQGSRGVKAGVPLSWRGKLEASLFGAGLPTEFKLKGYTSDSPRARETLARAAKAFSWKGGVSYPEQEYRGWLSSDYAVKDYAAFAALIDQYGVKTKRGVQEGPVIRKWLDGEAGHDALRDPVEVADQIIRRYIAVGRSIARYSRNPNAAPVMMVAATHAYLPEAVFERLAQTPFDSLTPSGHIRETESIAFAHTESGRTYLTYRNRTFDVTDRLSEILAATRGQARGRKTK